MNRHVINRIEELAKEMCLNGQFDFKRASRVIAYVPQICDYVRTLETVLAFVKSDLQAGKLTGEICADRLVKYIDEVFAGSECGKNQFEE